VRDLRRRTGEMREREHEFAVPSRLGEAVAVVPAGEQMKLEILLESIHEGILATVNVRTKVHSECVRCLRKMSAGLQVEFIELFAYTRTEADEYEVHGDHVDLEPPLRDAVVLALPFQPVCSPDCPGLDPESGELRAAGEAEAPLTGTDPRWAALAEFTGQKDRGEGVTSEPESK
jgi:uncharacterized protein